MAVASPETPVVLVLRALRLGDLLCAVPALRALRRGLAGHRLVLAAPRTLADLVPLIGAVDQLHDTDELAAVRWPGPRPLLAVNLHGRGPLSHRLLLAERPQRLLAFANAEAGWRDGPRWAGEEHEAVRWCRLVRWLGIAADPADLALPSPTVANPAPGVVVIHPGAASAARRWPVDRFARVARRLAAAGLPVVITGSTGEYRLATLVAARAGLGRSAVLAGRTTLTELAALVAGARLVICGDTGVGHLATAYRTPSVLLFGPVSPTRWGPLGVALGSAGGEASPPRYPHVVLWKGRTGDPHADVLDAGLAQIGVTEVVTAAERLLDGCPTGKAADCPGIAHVSTRSVVGHRILGEVSEGGG